MIVEDGFSAEKNTNELAESNVRIIVRYSVRLKNVPKIVAHENNLCGLMASSN